MNTSIDIVGYLLAVIPGFAFVWTYRHFTSAKPLGEFEYASWSFIWGVLLLILVLWAMMQSGHGNDPFFVSSPDSMSIVATLLGTGLGITFVAAFPLGYTLAGVSHTGLFAWIDKWLKKLAQ